MAVTHLSQPRAHGCCVGCLHPDYDGYFGTPTEYLAWYAKLGALRDRADAPTVAVLLYRKHVITQQGYIAQLVRCFEEDGVRPVPIFINGIEAHTVVCLRGTHHSQHCCMSTTGANVGHVFVRHAFCALGLQWDV